MKNYEYATERDKDEYASAIFTIEAGRSARNRVLSRLATRAWRARKEKNDDSQD